MTIKFNDNGKELKSIIKNYLIVYYEKLNQEKNKKDEYEKRKQYI